MSVPDPLNPRYSYGGGKIACELMANAWARTGVLDRASSPGRTTFSARTWAASM